MYEVDAPDMVRMGRPEPDDRAVPVVEPPVLLMPLRHLQPFFTPQAFNLIVVYLPALDTEQSRYLAVTVTPVVLRQPDQGQPQGIVITLGRLIVQGTAGYTNYPVGSSLGRRQLLTRMDNGLTKIPARQALGFRWLRLSLRVSLSSSSSATIFFRRAFSFSRLRSSDS